MNNRMMKDVLFCKGAFLLLFVVTNVVSGQHLFCPNGTQETAYELCDSETNPCAIPTIQAVDCSGANNSNNCNAWDTEIRKKGPPLSGCLTCPSSVSQESCEQTLISSSMDYCYATLDPNYQYTPGATPTVYGFSRENASTACDFISFQIIDQVYLSTAIPPLDDPRWGGFNEAIIACSEQCDAAAAAAQATTEEESGGTSTLGSDPFVINDFGERVQIWLPLDSYVPMLWTDSTTFYVRTIGKPGSKEQWIDAIAISTKGRKEFALQVEIPRDLPLGSLNEDGATTDQRNKHSLDFVIVKFENERVYDIGHDYFSEIDLDLGIRLSKVESKSILGLEPDIVAVTTADFTVKLVVNHANKYVDEGEADHYTHIDIKFISFEDRNSIKGFLADLLFARSISDTDARTYLRAPGDLEDGALSTAPMLPYDVFSLGDEQDKEDYLLPKTI